VVSNDQNEYLIDGAKISSWGGVIRGSWKEEEGEGYRDPVAEARKP
jgi:hypothetical protein